MNINFDNVAVLVAAILIAFFAGHFFTIYALTLPVGQ